LFVSNDLIFFARQVVNVSKIKTERRRRRRKNNNNKEFLPFIYFYFGLRRQLSPSVQCLLFVCVCVCDCEPVRELGEKIDNRHASLWQFFYFLKPHASPPSTGNGIENCLTTTTTTTTD
jgi:hypothetical protein